MRLENPAGVPAPFGDRFAHVARLDLAWGTLLLLSGQVALDEAGQVVAPGDVAAQTERIFEIVTGLLGAYGATLADVMHIRTYLTDMDDLPAYGAVRRRLFPAAPNALPPASTTVEVSRLFMPGLVIEIEVTAAVTGTV